MNLFTRTIPTSWLDSYVPARKRLPRAKIIDGTAEYTIPMLTTDEAPVAFIIHDKDWVRRSMERDDVEYCDVNTMVYTWDNKLWTPVLEASKHACGTAAPWDIEAMEKEIAYQGGKLDLFGNRYCAYNDEPIRDMDSVLKESKEAKTLRVQEIASQYIIINGLVCWTIGEPLYVVVTFGLGHNHGGTGAFIETHYNPNISHKNYFRSDEREKCIEYANAVAAGRGDTESIGHFLEHRNIEVVMPTCIRRNPAADHGDGDPFMNSCEKFINSSSNQAEAAVGVLALGVLGGK